MLNNDTKVHKEWLIFLLNLIESDKRIGMVGSKQIFPNGKLQEAGGIIWNNGECLKFGSGYNLDLPEYNYVKEVDYISGASILIRKSVWDKIGGFDKRYIPGYYGNIDFAFELRKNGYKVMYQPKSVVEYDEGISKRNSLSSDIKKYQIINKKKFVEKWKNDLKYQKEQGNTFLSRDRGYNRIFLIDSFVPSYNKNAGYRCTFMYLNLFKEIGLQVTFLPNDFQKLEPYTTILQQKGIEVLYGEWYQKYIENWLKNNLKYFNFVYLERPEIGLKYIDLIRQHFSGKIFYLFSKVDIIHVVGNYEYQVLKEKFDKKIIRNIPIYIYDQQLSNVEKDFSKRKNIIFVGGFSHSPNKDAVLWFSQYIYPKIVEKFQDMIWHIIGSNMPDDIIKLESKNIKIEGLLSDEDLYSLYQKCRIADSKQK